MSHVQIQYICDNNMNLITSFNVVENERVLQGAMILIPIPSRKSQYIFNLIVPHT